MFPGLNWVSTASSTARAPSPAFIQHPDSEFRVRVFYLVCYFGVCLLAAELSDGPPTSAGHDAKMLDTDTKARPLTSRARTRRRHRWAP